MSAYIKKHKWCFLNPLYEQENYDQAITHLDSLSRFSSDYGAEAKYMLARIYYLKETIIRAIH